MLGGLNYRALLSRLGGFAGAGYIGNRYKTPHAVALNLHKWIESDGYNLLGFINPALHSSIRDGTNTTELHERINLAMQDLADGRGGTLKAPAGVLLIGEPINHLRSILFRGQGVMNPDVGEATVIKLADGANCKMLQTPSGVTQDVADATHYMGIEQLVFDGNRDNQTRAAEFTAVDWLGSFLPGLLRLIFIRNVYGPGLKIGRGSGVSIANVWLYQCATDNYAFSVNEGYVNNSGLDDLDGLYVEWTAKATGYVPGETIADLQTTPTRRGNSMYFGTVGALFAGRLHVEGGARAVTIAGGQDFKAKSIYANYLGDGTDSVLVTISGAPQSIDIELLRARNVASGNQKLVEFTGGSDVYPDVDWSLALPVARNYAVVNPSTGRHGFEYIGGMRQIGRSSIGRVTVSAVGNYTVLNTDRFIDITSGNVTGVLLPAITGKSSTAFDGREIEVFNRSGVAQPIFADGAERIYPGGYATILVGHNEMVRLRGVPNIGWEHQGSTERETTRVTFFDDFLGDVISDQWNGRVGSDGQCVAPAILANQHRGNLRMTTGDDAGGTMALNGAQLESQLNWRANQINLVFEARVMISAITNVAVFVGLTDQVSALEMPFTLGASDALTSNASNAVGVLFDTGADTDNWFAVGVATDVDATHEDLGVAPVAATFETWRIEISNTGVARFYRNGVLVGSAMTGAVTTNVSLTPVVAAFSRGAAIRNIDLDFVFVQANR